MKDASRAVMFQAEQIENQERKCIYKSDNLPVERERYSISRDSRGVHSPGTKSRAYESCELDQE